MEEIGTERVPWWKQPVAVVVPAAILLAAVVAVALLGSQVASKGAEVRDLDADLTSVRDDLDAERSAGAELADELDTAKAATAKERKRADGAEAEALTKAETALADRTAEAAARSAALDQREADLTAREQQVDATLNGLRASQFSDGVHEVGRDIQPGRYHTDGTGRSCYYALLGPDGQDILDNNNVDGPVTVIISSPFFESSRCGTWTKVG